MRMNIKPLYRISLAGFLLALLASAAVYWADASPDNWNDDADTDWYYSAPTNPSYYIDTAEELAGVAKLVNEDFDGTIDGFKNKTIEVRADINLSGKLWEPIGTEQYPFKGTLIGDKIPNEEGGGLHDTRIQGMKVMGDLVYAGLVGYMEDATVGSFEFTSDGNIKVLSVRQSVYGVYAGSAVGLMLGDSTVYDITNRIAINVDAKTNNAFVGGIVGLAEGAVGNSVNYPAVNVSGAEVHAGGIVGKADRKGLIIRKAANNGAIKTSSAANGYAGGIVGGATGFVRMDEDVTPIANSGSVTAEGGRTAYAGGIVGRAGGELALSPRTSNTGPVTVSSPGADGTYAGGLAGAIEAEQAEPLFDLSYTNTVAIVNTGGTRVYTGGFAGFADSAVTWGGDFTNEASIQAKGASSVYTGGFIGYVAGQLQLNGKVNNAGTVDVSGSQPNQPDNAYTGGLAGYAKARLVLESTANRAYGNQGEIRVSGGNALYTGGIVSNRAYVRLTGEAVPNAYSSSNISVTGQTDMYTGGFIGAVAADGSDRMIKNAAYAGQITVAARASDASHTVRTGGIVGSYESGSGGGSIEDAVFSGKIKAAGGGADTYTGGIAGYMAGGEIKGARAGNTSASYAEIDADGSIGGVAGYAEGMIDSASVAYATLTMTKTDSVAGGIAGIAQGSITGSTVGAAAGYAGFDSVKLQAAVDNAVGGVDRIAAGGMIGRSEGALTITGSTATRVGLLTASGRSGYKLGAVAGILTAGATVGSAEEPVTVKDLNVTVNAGSSAFGSAVGLSHSPGLRVQASRVTIVVTGSEVAAGGLVGDNAGEAIGGLTQQVKLTSTGASSRIGGIAGSNSGALTDSETVDTIIDVSGTGTEAGGIAGHSAGANGEAPAIIGNARVHAADQPIITASGVNSTIGGIAGYAKWTEIVDPSIAAAPIYAVISAKAANIAVGGLAGRVEQGKIVGDAEHVNAENVIITTVAQASDAYVGGIAGYLDQTRTERITASNVSVTVNGPRSYVGGLAGYNRSSETGIVIHNYIGELNLKVNTPAESSTVGGLVGLNDSRSDDPNPHPDTAPSTLENNRVVGPANAILVSAPNSVTGGIVGENRSLIANTSISDKVPVISKGNGGTIGGLAGLNTTTGILYYTYSNATLTIEGAGASGGGLVGDNRGRVISSYVDVDVTGKAVGSSNQYVYLGGLIGRNSGSVEKSYTLSKVTSNGANSIAGGLVGEHAAGAISDSYAANAVIVNGSDSYAGGFLGRITAGTVTGSYSAGKITAASGAYAGGFIGRYDNANKELLNKSYYVKDADNGINVDLSDFAAGNHRWLNAPARLDTLETATLADRTAFPALSRWDFAAVWKYASASADYPYPELQRKANTGGEGGGSDVNANINWYIRDKDASHFELKSEAELAGLAAIVNGSIPGVTRSSFEGKTIRLLNPIHIQSGQWVPIGNALNRPFQGEFDGGNFLIDGLSVLPNQEYSGLFGVIGAEATVRSIRLEPLNVSGIQSTGALAGINSGHVSHIAIQLLKGVQVKGGIAGGAIGTNTGIMEDISLTLDGSRIEAAGSGAVVGGIVGDNTSSLVPGTFTIVAKDAIVRSSVANAIVGGYVGRQTGDVSGFRVDVTSALRVEATGANNTLGGLIGRHVSGKAENITVTFKDGILSASGADSTLGGVIGRSDADNVIRNVTVTTDRDGRHMTGNGTVGGIVGTKTGKGIDAFDMENVATDKVVLSTSDQSGSAVLGGIAGKLESAVVRNAKFTASLKAAGGRTTAGGIVGQAENSILYKVEAQPDITSASAAGNSAVGGIAGSLSSDDRDKEFHLGGRIPFYYGIYEANVHTKDINVQGANNNPDLFVGGIAGRTAAASIYFSQASVQIAVHGGKTATVGGIAGLSDNGVIVSTQARNGIKADTSVIYAVGGLVGRASGGAIHYSNVVASPNQEISVRSAAARVGSVPSAYVGGLLGAGDTTDITHSFAQIPVIVDCDNIENSIYAGGFAGLLGVADTGEGRIGQAYALGAVTVRGQSGSYVGGFAGSVDHYRVNDAYAGGNVANTGFDTRSGGFAAAVEQGATIANSYALQTKIATTGVRSGIRSSVGGFVGYNDGMLENVFAKAAGITVQVSGANVYKGALIGYNYWSGQIKESSYAGSGLDSIGRNIGQAELLSQKDLTGMLDIGYWDFEPDVKFLESPGAATIEIYDAKQLYGAALLYNDADLSFYRLYNRDAAVLPAMNKLLLKVDIDLTGKRWTPITEFRAELDGADKRIAGLHVRSASAGSAGFVADNYGKIANVVFDNIDIEAGTNTGAVAGINHAGATIANMVVSGTIRGGGNVGGIAGINEGRLERNRSGGIVSVSAPGEEAAAGGITGQNQTNGTIVQSLSYADVSVISDRAAAGGIAGASGGTIDNSYAAGRVKAEAAGEARAGGIVGHATDGKIRYSLSYGEATAAVDGKLQSGKTFWGGIAGQKEAAAEIVNNVFDKQMIKTNTAYFNEAGIRVVGSGPIAKGLYAKDLVAGTLPSGFDPSVWKAAKGFYPELAEFYGSAVSKISAAAVVLNVNDTVNSVRSGFELTRNTDLSWSADRMKISLSTASTVVKGSMRTSGSAAVTVAVQGASRSIMLNAPVLKYDEAASMPRVVAGEQSFKDQVAVELATDESGGSIYYTLNSGEPNDESLLYSGPIVLNATTTLRAVTIADGKENSATFTGVWSKQSSGGGSPGGGGGGGGGGGPVVSGPAVDPEPPVEQEPSVKPEPAVTFRIGANTTQPEEGASVVVAKNSRLVLTVPEGHVIYYTTDGSVPTENSNVYNGEIIITGSMTINVTTDHDPRVTTIHYQVANAEYNLKKEAARIPYMADYGNGQFKPDAAITRYELVDALAPLLDMEDVTVANPLRGVKPDMSELVAFFASAGIIEGYPDGSFGGDRGLSRAEFVVMLSRILKLDIANSTKGQGEAGNSNLLPDIHGHWAENYINAFVKAGYLKGFPDGTFRPDDQLSRAQTIVIINRIIGRQKQNLPSAYSDLPSSHWAYEDIVPVIK